MENKLKPCPFCGAEMNILLTDEEGNLRDKEYESNPWSGIIYWLTHPVDCVIGTHSGESLGCCGYDTREELIQRWNDSQPDCPESPRWTKEPPTREHIGKLFAVRYKGKEGVSCRTIGTLLDDDAGQLIINCYLVKYLAGQIDTEFYGPIEEQG